MTTAAECIVAKFGTHSKLAEVLGTHQTTVAYWVKVGTIPAGSVA
jgi:DNA-binding transcriptional regulator YdaS (Cro superfamily)